MTSSPCPAHQEQLHKTVYELLCILQGGVGRVAEPENIRSLGAQLVVHYERHVEGICREQDQISFEKEWSSLTWPLLSVLSRLALRPDLELHSLQLRLNTNLVNLVNRSRQSLPPSGFLDSEFAWQTFWNYYSQALNTLHELYSQIDHPSPALELRLVQYGRQELRMFLDSFREVILKHSQHVLPMLRQVNRMCHNRPMDDGPAKLASAFYCNILYTLGVLSARLQGFRWESLQTKYRFSAPDPVRPLLEMVFTTTEQLISDCLLGAKPSTNAILVTNNLFPFNCACLPPAILFQQFDVQIVSEETAQAIQGEMSDIKRGHKTAGSISSFPSAALLAMKPTSGVKRNNAVANAEGGNTAHKKSDVNSKEMVTITPSWNDKYGGWQAQYPHLLCTTRQKDTVLLDTRSGQMGKRPLFYFYIKGILFSPSGHVSYVRTLSLPFTIATRRNQDCQVQRMMSSYTATCFWLYGLKNSDGLLLNWCDTGIEWPEFVELYRSYFTVNAEVTRTLSDDDFRLMKDKLTCDECREFKHDGEDRLITFKNVLCPHLKYDVDQNQMRFSIWRGLLEVLQIYQDARTNVKLLWNDYVLMGFSDIEEINCLLAPHLSTMCLRISHVIGGSICIAMKPGLGNVIHLEPIDLKRLQAKSIFEYLSDIAVSAKIEFILNANRELIPVVDLIRKYGIGAEHGKVRSITTNISHGGTVEKMTKMRFTPMRIAVVTCGIQDRIDAIAPPMMPPTTATNGYHNGNSNSGGTFETQLEALMKTHGKTASDVITYLNYPDTPTSAMNWSLENPMLFTPDYGQWEQQQASCSMVSGSTPFV